MSSVVLLELHEASVFDAVALGRRGREDNPLAQLLFGKKLNFVVGTGQHPDPLCLVLIFVRHSVGQAKLFGLESGAKFLQRKATLRACP